MTYHIKDDFPVEQLSSMAWREASARRDIPFGGTPALIAAVAMGLWKLAPAGGEELAA
jgi:hypothetical protein